MIRALIDANAIVSLYTAKVGTLVELRRRLRDGAFTLFVSEAILDEVMDAWAKPYWQNRVSAVERRRFHTLIKRQSETTALSVDVRGIASHPEDDLVLSAALSAGVDYLVTGDTELLSLIAFEGIPIVTARQFVEFLDRR